MDTENEESNEKCKPLHHEARDIFIVKGRNTCAQGSWVSGQETRTVASCDDSSPINLISESDMM